MAKGVSVEVSGIQEVRRFLNNKSKQATRLMSKGLARAAIHVQGKVKISIAGQAAEPKSVDTGRFLNSVGIRASKNDAEVFSDLSYAKTLEFGSSKRKERRHFRNTASREKQRVSQILDKELNKL